jgi:hypothetical protein
MFGGLSLRDQTNDLFLNDGDDFLGLVVVFCQQVAFKDVEQRGEEFGVALAV